MPNHKFIDELNTLENSPRVGDYHMLVVGTFNADIPGNDAGWFYGRPENEFWCLLPRMLGFPTLHPVDRDEPIGELVQMWKRFCNDNRIVIVDMFKQVQIDLTGHADKLLYPLQPNQYTPFNFEQAFANAHFEHVLFTWKGFDAKQGTLTMNKQLYVDYFTGQGSNIMHMLTPSNAFSETRWFKLNSWRANYIHL